ncbi:hypothetical protein MHYP_G00286900 [Metynnis hypsauchen]
MNGTDTDVFQIGWGHNYTVPAVGPGDSGQYFCLAQNALGSQNSTVITIRVQDSKDPDHLLFVRAALGALLFAGIVTVTLLYFIKRYQKSLPQRGFLKILLGFTIQTLELAELRFQPAMTDRSTWTRKEDISVVYIIVGTHTIAT